MICLCVLSLIKMPPYYVWLTESLYLLIAGALLLVFMCIEIDKMFVNFASMMLLVQ